MPSQLNDVDSYIATLPADRRDAISRVRDVINANVPAGYEEKLQYGMIAWCVPESVLPAKDVYNQQPLTVACLGSQKNHMAVYLMCVYGDPEERTWFEAAYKKSGKKLDMGKSCVRFRSLDALPLDVIGEAISHFAVDKYVASYRKVREGMASAANANAKPAPAKPTPAKGIAARLAAARVKPSTAKTSAAKTSTAKNSPAKKTAAKKPAPKKAAKKSSR